MPVFPFIRQCVLGATIVFSIIELALAAHLISLTQQYYRVTATFCSLAVAVAVISLVTLPVMLFVDIIRRGAFTSMIVVELVWLSILWILWVASAAETVSAYNLYFPFGCDTLDTIYNNVCQEVQAIEAFSFLSFIIILLYSLGVFVMAMIATSNGTNVWLSSVKESFSSSGGTAEHPMTQYNTAASPPQFHTPQGVAPAPASV